MDKPETPVPAMIIMGVRSEVHGNYDAAEALYRRVLKVEPKQAVAANNLAMILSRKESSVDEALDLAKMAVQITPNRATIWDTLALMQEKKKMYSPALDSMQQALRLEPDSAEWRVHKCEILIKASRKQEARQVVIEIEALPPAPLTSDVQKRLDAVKEALNKEASKQAALP